MIFLSRGIHKQEENLFQNWKKRQGLTSFVKDGVTNEQSYKASGRKVAFILKEYPNKESDYDLRQKELSRTFGGGWRKVAEILKGINIKHNPEVNNEGVPEKMPDNICAFNLKKESGQSNWPAIYYCAGRDRNFIRRQFEIYDPDLALCMGYNAGNGDMLELFRKVMGHDQISKKHTKKDRWSCRWGWYERSPGKIVMGTYHMSDRGRSRQSSEDVLALVGEIDADL